MSECSSVLNAIGGIVLAAGQSKRMQSLTLKIFQPLAGRCLIDWVLDEMDQHAFERTAVVLSKRALLENESEHLTPSHPYLVAIQEQPLGTADAVLKAVEAFKEACVSVGHYIIVCGDTPFFSNNTFNILKESTDDLTFMISRLDDHHLHDPYGRVILDFETNDVLGIVEYKDASDMQRQIPWMNGGLYKISASLLDQFLSQSTNDNVSKEYYLTDIVNFAKKRGFSVKALEVPFEETLGINTPDDFETCEVVMQRRLRRRHQSRGVRFIHGHLTTLHWDTKIGAGTVVEPYVSFSNKVHVGENVRLKSYVYLKDCIIQDQAVVGPFAHVREQSVVGSNAQVGNFVELKKASMAFGSKAKHLSYLGDAEVGEKTNIGAGCVTANYDGVFKHKSIIGKNVSLGAHTVLVAPIVIGDQAITAAGSTIVEDIPKNALGIARKRQIIKLDFFKRYHEKLKRLKDLMAPD